MKKRNGIIVYESLKEIVDPEHTCLIVWDVQNGLVDLIFNREAFMANLRNFIEKLRGKMPVVYTVIRPMHKDFTSAWRFFSLMRRFHVHDIDKLPSFMEPGSKEREIPEMIKPQNTDIVLEKSTASIFVGTDFESMMRNRNITTLLFTGIATEMGIESSARDASNRGFYPVVVSNCVSSFDKEAHDRSLMTMEKLCIVETSGNVIKNID
jgi:nicotinamidase-related amidase